MLGVDKTHRVSIGDLESRCPGCYGNNTTSVGTLNVAGAAHGVTKCENCNRLFSRPDGGIASLIDEAKEVFKVDNVGFVPGGSGPAVTATIQSGTGYQANQPGLEEMRNQLSNIASNTSHLYSLQDSIERLLNSVDALTKQNVELMNRLATDQLVGIRKTVSEFNLK